MTPLDEFKARWEDVEIPVPFVEVVNTQVDLDALPDEWGSAMLQSERRDDVSLGEFPWVEEQGVIIVGLFARAGSGRAGLDEATTMLREMFHGYTSEDQTITFTGVIGPEDIDPDADGGEWWRLGFTIPYTVQGERVSPTEILDTRPWWNEFHIFVHQELGQ